MITPFLSMYCSYRAAIAHLLLKAYFKITTGAYQVLLSSAPGPLSSEPASKPAETTPKTNSNPENKSEDDAVADAIAAAMPALD